MGILESLFDPRARDGRDGGSLGGYPWPAPASGAWPDPIPNATGKENAAPGPTALQNVAPGPAGGGGALVDVAAQPLPSEPDLVQDALRAGAATIGRRGPREKIPPASDVETDRYYLAPVPQAPTWEQTVTTATPWSPLAKPPSPTSWGEQTTGIECRTSGGNTHCTTAGGHQFDLPEAFPDGLTIAPGQPHYHYYSTPDGPVRFDSSALTQGVIDSPTVGPPRLVRPATPQGTLNEATPNTVYGGQSFATSATPFGGPMPPFVDTFNPVRSYLTKDQNGMPMVVNVTRPEHGLHPGIVVRYVTESPSGATIQNEGTGLGWLQTPGYWSAGPISRVWQGQAEQIMRKMQGGSR